MADATPTLPQPSDATELVSRLRRRSGEDHQRGCAGREYACTCRFNAESDELFDQAADFITQAQTKATAAEDRIEELEADLREAQLASQMARRDRDRAEGERDRANVALAKINAIRNSIIGLQSINWSEHIYPLVAALDEAGIEGQDYPEARANVGTLLERTNAAEAQAEAAQQTITQLTGDRDEWRAEALRRQRGGRGPRHPR